jgi:hypothetical protein
MRKMIALATVLCAMAVALLAMNAYYPLAISFTSGLTAHPGDTVEVKIILTAWWKETDVKLSLLSVPKGFTYAFSQNPVHVVSRDVDSTWRTSVSLNITVDKSVEDGTYEMLFVWDDQTNDPQRQVCGSSPIKITVISETATVWPTKLVTITETTTFTTIYRTESTTTTTKVQATWFTSTATTGTITRTTYAITTQTIVVAGNPITKFFVDYFGVFMALIVGAFVLIFLVVYKKF